MKPDFQRDLIPRDDALQLIGTLNAMKDKLHDAAQQCELLDENGHVPAAPSYTALLQHVTDAQELSRDVLHLTADFARSPHHTTRTGSTVLKHLATAATMSSHAAPHFSETAECALTLPRSANPTDRHYFTNRMVIDHASARAFLRRTSESLRDASKELHDHLDFQGFLTTLTRQEAPPAPRHPGRAVATADRACSGPRSTHIPRNALNRPAHFSDADWAEYQQCQAEHDHLMAQVADREAQLEDDLIAAYDEYELDFSPVPKQETDLTRRTPPPHRLTSRRRSRGR